MRATKKLTRNLRKLDRSGPLVRFSLFAGLILFGFWLGSSNGRMIDSFLNRVLSRVSRENIISANDLNRSLENKDFVLINVHTPYEGEIGKTDTFIEYDSLKATESRFPSDKNTSIVLYCKSGNMSAQSLKTLKSMGYTNVRHLEGGMDAWKKQGFPLLDLSDLPTQVLPETGFELPISWGDIAPKLIELGVIDKAKFEKAVAMGDAEKQVFEGRADIPIRINRNNSQFVVDLLWAFGLAQKSLVYEEGPMGKEYKGKAGNFSSTGGWTLARGKAMDHYNMHDFIPLTEEEHKKVMAITSNVYRPCCGNHTAFPDCNHGMAALAAIELMVAKGMSEDEIYKNVLELNSFWFPSSYLTTATYFARQGTAWDKVDAKEALGINFSSSQGASKIAQQVGPLPFETKLGGSCGA